MICPFCSVQNMKENDYCSKCGKPLNTETLKELEQKAQTSDLLQEIIRSELEKKGIDLAEITRVLTAKN